MASSLFQKSPKNNPLGMLNQFKQFAQGFTPQGAKNILEQKVKSGEISQAELDSAIQQAQGFMNMFR